MTWARGRGIALVALEAAEPLPPGIERALRDGIERGYEGDPPRLAADARRFLVAVGGEVVGLLAVRTGWPAPDVATIVAVAIDPARRGRSSGMRALLLAARALAAEGYARCFAVVPRTNGRGLYFMLRCGYAPVLDPSAGARRGGDLTCDVTWFARVEGAREV